MIAVFMQTLIVWLAERDDAPNLVEEFGRMEISPARSILAAVFSAAGSVGSADSNVVRWIPVASVCDSTSWRVRIHRWRPDAEPYDGQPKDFEEARRRRNERLVVEQVAEPIVSNPVAAEKLSEYCIDLRRRKIRET